MELTISTGLSQQEQAAAQILAEQFRSAGFTWCQIAERVARRDSDIIVAVGIGDILGRDGMPTFRRHAVLAQSIDTEDEREILVGLLTEWRAYDDRRMG